MPSDDEKDDRSTHLMEREQFIGWKSSMRLHAMSKGDSYGIFDEDGTQGTYVALQAPQRRSWMVLMELEVESVRFVPATCAICRCHHCGAVPGSVQHV